MKYLKTNFENLISGPKKKKGKRTNGGIGVFPSAASQLKDHVIHLLIRVQFFSALTAERIHNALIHSVLMAYLAKYLWHAVIAQTASNAAALFSSVLFES